LIDVFLVVDVHGFVGIDRDAHLADVGVDFSMFKPGTNKHRMSEIIKCVARRSINTGLMVLWVQRTFRFIVAGLYLYPIKFYGVPAFAPKPGDSCNK
jgi:hypothetical protein